MTEAHLKVLKRFRRFIHWLLAASLVLYVVTGFGITEWQTIEPLTLGLLDKVTSMKIHNNFEWPFTALLAVHISVSLIYRKKEKTAMADATQEESS